MERGIFQRSQLLLGEKVMKELSQRNVIIFGIGGVGSWCAESLVRTGMKNITLVDSDRVCITNVNRQLHATVNTVGSVKTEALKERLLAINPNAQITALQKIYSEETYDEFNLHEYDFIVDAIDSLQNKLHLIRTATRMNASFFCSMGAALRIDPTRIQVSEFWDVQGCPFARRIRKVIRKGDLPAKKFMCVYSDEVLPNLGAMDEGCGTDSCLCPKNDNLEGDPALAKHEWCSSKAVINGSMAHMTANFGFTIAGLIIKEIYDRCNGIENYMNESEY